MKKSKFQELVKEIIIEKNLINNLFWWRIIMLDILIAYLKSNLKRKVLWNLLLRKEYKEYFNWLKMNPVTPLSI
jgi:hypothetical protein